MSEQNNNQSQLYDDFVERMLGALFELGLMPMKLDAAPAEFDKYPQRLLVLLRTTGDVDKAFVVWRSELLRKQKYSSVKEAAFPKLEGLGTWLRNEERRQLLQSPSVIRHLRQSMYGRSYAYLYPRLTLIFEYRDRCKQEPVALETIKVQTGGSAPKEFYRAIADQSFITEHFNAWTPVTQERIKEAFGNEAVRPLLEAAQAFLIQSPHWFNKVFSPKS